MQWNLCIMWNGFYMKNSNFCANKIVYLFFSKCHLNINYTSNLQKYLNIIKQNQRKLTKLIKNIIVKKKLLFYVIHIVI